MSSISLRPGRVKMLVVSRWWWCCCEVYASLGMELPTHRNPATRRPLMDDAHCAVSFVELSYWESFGTTLCYIFAGVHVQIRNSPVLHNRSEYLVPPFRFHCPSGSALQFQSSSKVEGNHERLSFIFSAILRAFSVQFSYRCVVHSNSWALFTFYHFIVAKHKLFSTSF